MHHNKSTNPDLSCLLTPPHTPLYPEGSAPGPNKGHSLQPNGHPSRSESKKVNGLIPNGLEGKDSVTCVENTGSLCTSRTSDVQICSHSLIKNTHK